MPVRRVCHKELGVAGVSHQFCTRFTGLSLAERGGLIIPEIRALAKIDVEHELWGKDEAHDCGIFSSSVGSSAVSGGQTNRHADNASSPYRCVPAQG